MLISLLFRPVSDICVRLWKRLQSFQLNALFFFDFLFIFCKISFFTFDFATENDSETSMYSNWSASTTIYSMLICPYNLIWFTGLVCSLPCFRAPDGSRRLNRHPPILRGKISLSFPRSGCPPICHHSRFHRLSSRVCHVTRLRSSSLSPPKVPDNPDADAPGSLRRYSLPRPGPARPAQ